MLFPLDFETFTNICAWAHTLPCASTNTYMPTHARAYTQRSYIRLILQLNFSLNIFWASFYVSTYYTGKEKFIFIHACCWTFRLFVLFSFDTANIAVSISVYTFAYLLMKSSFLKGPTFKTFYNDFHLSVFKSEEHVA